MEKTTSGKVTKRLAKEKRGHWQEKTCKNGASKANFLKKGIDFLTSKRYNW